jgi:acyl carrier protein
MEHWNWAVAGIAGGRGRSSRGVQRSPPKAHAGQAALGAPHMQLGGREIDIIHHRLRHLSPSVSLIQRSDQFQFNALRISNSPRCGPIPSSMLRQSGNGSEDRARFLNHLGADWPDRLELVIVVEDHFGIGFADDEFERPAVVCDLIRRIEAHAQLET